MGFVVFALGLLLMVFEGFALQNLYGWFIVPKFAQEPLSLPVAIGITLIFGLLTTQTDNPPEDDNSDVLFGIAFYKIGIAAIRAFLLLVIGFAVKQFM